VWARLLSAALGAWLMAAPDVLGYGGTAGVNDHVVGPIVVGSAVAAAWPVMRPLRWVGLVVGAWLLVPPWIFGYYGTVAMENGSVVSFLLAARPAGRPERERVRRGMEKPSREKG